MKPDEGHDWRRIDRDAAIATLLGAHVFDVWCARCGALGSAARDPTGPDGRREILLPDTVKGCVPVYAPIRGSTP